MRIRLLIPLLLLTALIAVGCRNAPEDERGDLHRDFVNVDDDEREAMRVRLRRLLMGDAIESRDGDPHIRATAAQGIGELGNPEDADLLLEALLGPLADEGVLVRIECAIALGKLKYPDILDKTRQEVILALRARIAFERDEMGRPIETEFLVRTAMLSSLIAIGERDVAAALHDIAARVLNDIENTDGVLFTSATDRGLLDRCFDGLAEVVGVSKRAAARNRFENDDLSKHLDWWTDRIAAMPES